MTIKPCSPAAYSRDSECLCEDLLLLWRSVAIYLLCDYCVWTDVGSVGGVKDILFASVWPSQRHSILKHKPLYHSIHQTCLILHVWHKHHSTKWECVTYLTNTTISKIILYSCILIQNCFHEHINSLQCYELTRSCSHLLFTYISPLIYAVHPWSVHCECATKHNRWQIYNYLHIWDTVSTGTYGKCPYM